MNKENKIKMKEAEEQLESLEFLGSVLKSLQIIYVINDVRDCCRIPILKEEYEKVKCVCDSNGLKTIRSDITFSALPGYNDGIKTEKESSTKDTSLFVYISKDYVKARALKDADDLQEHHLLGRLLGYPSCCIKFFSDNIEEEKKTGFRFIFPLIDNSKDKEYPFIMNVFRRYEDKALLHHCPCSLKCRPSMIQAKERLYWLRENLPKTAEFFEDSMKGDIIIKDRKGNSVTYLFS